VLKVGGDDGGEPKFGGLEVVLNEGEAGEGGGEESHGEGPPTLGEEFILAVTLPAGFLRTLLNF